MLDLFIDLSKQYRHVYSLAAIWFDHGIQTSTERTPRITKDHLIRLENGNIVNVTDDLPATHKVIDCKGTIANNILLMELENLETGETYTLNVKNI